MTTHPTIGDELMRLEMALSVAIAARNWDEVQRLSMNLKATDRMAASFGPEADHLQAMIGHRVVW